MMLYGYAQSRKILKEWRPEMVMGVGGYASLPMVLAARGMQIPCSIHEQNAIPGLTNRLLARFADQVFITLDESATFFPKGKTLLTVTRCGGRSWTWWKNRILSPLRTSLFIGGWKRQRRLSASSSSAAAKGPTPSTWPAGGTAPSGTIRRQAGDYPPNR